MKVSSRHLFLLGFLSCLFAFATVLFLQLFQGVMPCPLCVMQRVGLLVAACFFLLGTLWKPNKIYAYSILSLAILGLIFGEVMAARQVWLQFLPPDQIPACGPGIGYLFENLPFHKALLTVFQGSGDCAQVHVRLLGLSLAEWSLLWFSFMLFFSGVLWCLLNKIFQNEG